MNNHPSSSPSSSSCPSPAAPESAPVSPEVSVPMPYRARPYVRIIRNRGAFDICRCSTVRPVLSVACLAVFLGAQTVMPNVLTLQAASAAEARVTKNQAAARKRQEKPAPDWHIKREKKEAVERKLMAERRNAKAPASIAPPSLGTRLAQLVGLGDGAKPAASLQSAASKPGRILPSAPVDCVDCEVTMQALDLKKTPTERDLRRAGQLGGALDPTRPAEPSRLAARLRAVMSARGIPGEVGDLSPATLAQDEAALANPKTTGGRRALALARKELARSRDINQSFGEAIQQWNKHNFRGAAKMFQAHIEDYSDSPWNGEAMLHLGCDAKYNGRFAEAEKIYSDILNASSDDVTSSSSGFRKKQGSRLKDLRKSGQSISDAAGLQLSAPEDVTRLNKALKAQTAEALIEGAVEKVDLSFDIRQKAKARWADLDLSTGRLGDALDKLKDIAKNDTDWHRRTWAESWFITASMYQANARDIRACGSRALGYVLAGMGQQDKSQKLLALKPNNRNGFSLDELAKLSSKYGIPMRGFRATGKTNGERAARLASLPLPMILHYDFGGSTLAQTSKVKIKSPADKLYQSRSTSGHFVVVRRVDAAKKQVSLFDPQEKRIYNMGYADLEREWSGTGLIMAKAAVKSVDGKRVAFLNDKEMRNLLGGCCGTFSPTVGCGCTDANQGSGPGGCGNKGGSGSSGPISTYGGGPVMSYGSPTISINRTNHNIFVIDTPMWYKTPKGPDVELTMSYNSQDALTQANPFGNKWMFNYGSYIVEDTAAGGGRVIVFMPDGSQQAYTPDGQGGYTGPAGTYDTLVKTGQTHYEIISQLGDKSIYDIPSGTSSLQPFMVELRDRWGYSLNFTYTDLGPHTRLTSIKDASDKITTLRYDNAGHITSVWDPFGRHVTFSYDANGNMVEAVDMEGHAFQYTYDATINLTQLNTAQGPWKFLLTSDTYTQTMKVTDPANKSQVWYFVAWPTYSYTDQNGVQSAYTVTVGADGRGHVANVNAPGSGGQIDSTQYDAGNAKPSTMTDEAGNSMHVSYNSAGHPINITDGKSQTVQLHYAANAIDITSVEDTSHQTITNYLYDSFHQPIQITDAAGNSKTLTYTPWGAPATISEGGHTTQYVYDSSGLHVETRIDAATVAAFSYDKIGRVKTLADSEGLVVALQYNNIDHIVKITYPDGTDIKYDYVCCGLPGVVTDRAGRKSYYDYDSMRRPTRIQYPQGNTTQIGYDGAGQRTQLIDGQGAITRWAFDGQRRLVKKTYDNGSSESYAYSQGLLVAKRNARGTVVRYTYDANGNLTKIDYPTTADVNIQYNAFDKPVAITDGIGTSTFAYDSLGRLIEANGPFSNDTVSYTYDAQGRRRVLGVQKPDGSTTETEYNYDSIGRLGTIANNAGVFTYSYDGLSKKITRLSLPNGAKTNYGYTDLGELNVVENLQADGSNLSRYGYSFNTAGAREELQENIGSDIVRQLSFTYDDSTRLTAEQTVSSLVPENVTTNYVYDAAGNRTASDSLQGGNTHSQSLVNNALNQTLSATTSTGSLMQTVTYTYDKDGNISAASSDAGSLEYTFDDASRLSSVTQKDSAGNNLKRSEFLYDSSSRLRISKEAEWQAGAWTVLDEKRRIYDDMTVVQERDGSGALVAENTYGIDSVGDATAPLARHSNGGFTFFHYDGRANVTGLSDADGNVCGRYGYDAFGKVISISSGVATTNPYRYSSKEQIGGLNYFGFRFYSPGMGKWINRDPIQEFGGINLYSFVGGNPVNHVDLYGLWGVVGGGGVDVGTGAPPVFTIGSGGNLDAGYFSGGSCGPGGFHVIGNFYAIVSSIWGTLVDSSKENWGQKVGPPWAPGDQFIAGGAVTANAHVCFTTASCAWEYANTPNSFAAIGSWWKGTKYTVSWGNGVVTICRSWTAGWGIGGIYTKPTPLFVW